MSESRDKFEAELIREVGFEQGDFQLTEDGAGYMNPTVNRLWRYFTAGELLGIARYRPVEQANLDSLRDSLLDVVSRALTREQMALDGLETYTGLMDEIATLRTKLHYRETGRGHEIGEPDTPPTTDDYVKALWFITDRIKTVWTEVHASLESVRAEHEETVAMFPNLKGLTA